MPVRVRAACVLVLLTRSSSDGEVLCRLVREAVVAAATLRLRRVRAAGRAAGASDSRAEVQPLALVAPAPPLLPVWAGWRVVEQAVVSAATLRLRRVRAAGRAAGASDSRAEVQPLALVAPAPPLLPVWAVWRVVGQAVVPTAALGWVGVPASGWAIRLRQTAAEEEALTLVAPPPVRLRRYRLWAAMGGNVDNISWEYSVEAARPGADLRVCGFEGG
ncbi:MAG TPA: hypothetical protein VI094_09480 [Propionibacteriaceae bacterium]